MRIEGVTGFQAAAGDVALLVDGENLPPAHAANLLGLARGLGSLRVARVYGRSTHLGDWHTEPGFKVVVTTARPQAADLQIAIDAVAMAHAAGVRSFIVASDDRDFTAVAFHLREAGCFVLGAGTAKSPACLREAFSRFDLLGCAAPCQAPESADLSKRPTDRTRLVSDIREFLLKCGEKQSEVPLTDLAQDLKRKGYIRAAKGWRVQLIEEFSDTCEVLGAHPNIFVRLIGVPDKT